MSANNTTSRGPTVILGVIGALAGFAVVTALLQGMFGGKPADAGLAQRLEKKAAVAEEQAKLLEKYGLADSADTVFAKAADQLKARKVAVSIVAVPGSPTALKQAAAAAAAAPPAPAPASKAAASKAPAPSPAPVAPPK